MTSRAPYQRAILDAVSDPTVETVVVMSSAQIGKTEMVLNTIGYYIDQDPSPILCVQPTLEMAQAFSKDRLAPMLRDSPCLMGAVNDPRTRDSGNTLLHKTFEGGHITISGANSPASLASRPVRIVLCDEVDRYPESAGAEGDPVKLAFKRSTTFWNRKHILTSTPTIKGASRIEQAYLASDMRKYYTPCPYCGEHQLLLFPQVKWPKGKPKEAHYECVKCEKEINERAKIQMVVSGVWKAGADFNRTAGFWINELYSPWVSMGQIAENFLEAKKTPEDLQVFVNTSLAETWEEVGDAPDWQKVYDLKMPYKITEVPKGVKFITAGVDVQKNRLVFAIRGWGSEQESWLIDFGELWGETDQMEVWNRLSELIDNEYGGMPIRLMLMDSGYRNDFVYTFARRHRGRVWATKGQLTQDKPIKMSRIDVTRSGKVMKGGMSLWHINTDYFKSWVHARVNWEPAEPGAWHLCQDATEDYCKQIVAESLIIAPNGKHSWIKSGRNDFFDCEVLNAAGAYNFRIELRKKISANRGTPPKGSGTGRGKGGGYVNRWRR